MSCQGLFHVARLRFLNAFREHCRGRMVAYFSPQIKARTFVWPIGSSFTDCWNFHPQTWGEMIQFALLYFFSRLSRPWPTTELYIFTWCVHGCFPKRCGKKKILLWHLSAVGMLFPFLLVAGPHLNAVGTPRQRKVCERNYNNSEGLIFVSANASQFRQFHCKWWPSLGNFKDVLSYQIVEFSSLT